MRGITFILRLCFCGALLIVAPSFAQQPNTSESRQEIAISELQETIRFLSGRVEELEYNQRRTQELLQQLERELDLRLQSAATATVQDPTAPPVIGESPETPTNTAEEVKGSPQEDYQTAFDVLNEGDYDEAERLFSQFITRYPDETLIGNAHYWLGETYYVQEQFDAAAEEFRKGFQQVPDGSKAADNLLRLGMTLGVLERGKEACVVLKQLLSKYADKSAAVKRKATKESDKLGCS